MQSRFESVQSVYYYTKLSHLQDLNGATNSRFLHFLHSILGLKYFLLIFGKKIHLLIESTYDISEKKGTKISKNAVCIANYEQQSLPFQK